MGKTIRFIGSTNNEKVVSNMIRYGFPVPKDKFIIEVFDITKSDFHCGKPILTNEQIQELIVRYKGTHKEDKIKELKKSLFLQKYQIVDEKFILENNL
jgi:methyltransferase-like protein